MHSIPTVDLTRLRTHGSDSVAVRRIDDACRTTGCLRVVGHGLPDGLRSRLDRSARAFFALDETEKAQIAMPLGGRAWRGWFPLGDELTSGVPDMKEGLYFGTELPADDPRVMAGRPLHGANLFPARVPELRTAVLEHMTAVTAVGQVVLRALAEGLGLGADWFVQHLTDDPVVLFRIFRYPPLVDGAALSVGEHTDYGLLTLLVQDGTPGLEFRTDDGWAAVDPDPDAIVVNLGDMLERMSAGTYRSTVHRVRNTSNVDRLSFPLFLDPGWDTEVRPLPGAGDHGPGLAARWDGEDPHLWHGTYGEYLVSRVAKVFPHLADREL